MSTGENEPDFEYDGMEQPPKEGIMDPAGREYRPYIPDEGLKEAVKLAIALNMPLLLEGEPGCGKTCLAGAIVYEFTQRYLQGKVDKEGHPLWYPFEVWNITSSTRAVDGKYTYDALRRLRDAQLAGSNLKDLEIYLGESEVKRIIDDLQNPTRYRTLGKLGRSFERTDYRPILLIDEIDKADNDFPNDLLREIEDFRFEIPETREIIPNPEQKDNVKKPIIMITSNKEKPLPDPFLRRCIYYYVGFPESDRLRAIVYERFGKGTNAQERVKDQAIVKFYYIRTLLNNQPGIRAPGTSEFLKFLEALLAVPTELAQEKLNTLNTQRSLLGILVKDKTILDLVSRELASS